MTNTCLERLSLVAPVLHAQYTQEAVVNVNELSGWSRDNDGKAGGGAQANFQQPKSTEVYLPSGTAWYDFWTNEKIEGGREITRETTLDLIPLYIKAGSIVPFWSRRAICHGKAGTAWFSVFIRVPTAVSCFTKTSSTITITRKALIRRFLCRGTILRAV